jgi:hypothetical protein
VYIYRIEHKETGKGPFGSSGPKLDNFHDGWPVKASNHPTPYHDIGRFIRMDEACACQSLEQLRLWFTENDERRFEEHGYQCLRLRIDKRTVVVGKWQVLYMPRSVTGRKVISLYR